MADLASIDNSSLISVVSLIISFLSGALTAVMGYLKQKDGTKLKEVEMDLKKADEERQVLSASLAACHQKHEECEKNTEALRKENGNHEVRTAKLEVEVSFLKQQMSSRPG